MKVVIYEKEHFEGAFPVIKLFDLPGNEITIITSTETHKRFLDLFGKDSGRFKWVILQSKGKLSFFCSLYKSLKKQKADILYINTISDNHWLYAFILRRLHVKRVIMTVHDVNCLFESKPSLNFRQWVIHTGKKKLIKEINEFNIVADTMTAYLQTKTRKKTHNIPGAVFENRYSPQNSSAPLKITIPGSLDKRRRNYDHVFELAQLADKEKLPLELILLGGFYDEYGKSIIDRAHHFQSGYCRITCYTTHIVDQKEFDRQMDAAHFVFIPSVVDTKICGDIPEVYGITKSSGNIFDVIKHAKPFIVPAALTISPALQTGCFKYKELKDIISFLKRMVASPSDYDTWQSKALENSRNYTIDKVRERNSSLFE